MNVKKYTVDTWQQALIFTELQLENGANNIRIITAQAKTAKKYGLTGTQAQVRYW